MLIELKNEEFEKYIDWAYELALDLTRSSYPTYTDGIKTKEDFMRVANRAFSSENNKILLFSYENQVLGWIHYYLIPEDKYIGLYSFNTEKKTKQALSEFENYCRTNFKGYSVYLGFAAENKEAINFFKENKYELLEISNPTVFHFKNFSPIKCSDKIIKITKENYYLFQKLHKQADSDMYWNSERILHDFENWQIYYFDDGKTQSAIYFNGEKIKEVYGVDFSDDYAPAVFRELIVKCMNVCYLQGTEHLYYFSEENEKNFLTKLGFKCLGEYNCYLLRLT